MGVKLVMYWENVEGDQCKLEFLYANYNDDPQVIYGGLRPFVLSEFNSDDDIFKPVRPQIATIEILASSSGVKMEDFISDNDTDIEIRFSLAGYTNYWIGYLSQDDIEETWISTNHILILRAYEGVGTLKDAKLVDENGNNLIGKYTFLELLNYARSGVIGDLLGAKFFCNLFHTSMSSSFNQMGLDQCKVDARTFEKSPGEFDDRYTVLEKILKSWNMTMFQFRGEWTFLRIPEYFTSGNIVGFVNGALGRSFIEQRYDIEVGINKSVKPIMPEMLKTLNKPSKTTNINYQWEEHLQVACNESFKSGDYLSTIGTVPNETDIYSVSQWEHLKYPVTSPSNAGGIFQRELVFKDYKLDDEYVVLSKDTTGVSAYIRSCDIYVNAGDDLTIEFQFSLKSNVTTALQAIGFVQFYANDSTYYTLDDDRPSISVGTDINGTWAQSNSSWTINFRLLQFGFDTGTGANWETFQIKATLPKSGYFNLSLLKDGTSTINNIYFRDLNISVIPNIQKKRRRIIAGDYDRYEINKQVLKSFNDTIFFDDSDSVNYKGAILESDGLTLTGDQWYRKRTFNDTTASSERLTFKRQNALSHWFINRSYKTKINANFFGLKWNDAGFDQPIGLINTIKFVDDAPTKIYWIANLKEIDFMSCTWSATLFEVFDTSVEDNEPTDQDIHSFDFYYE